MPLRGDADGAEGRGRLGFRLASLFRSERHPV